MTLERLAVWTRPLKTKVAGLQRFIDNDFYPVFVCGVAGSGTTLLLGLLDQRFENAASFKESALVASEGSILKMNSVAFYGSLSAYYSAMFIPDHISNRRVRQETIQLYRNAATYPKQSRVVLDKAPNVHLVRAAKLRKAFPHSKFLLIFRNPAASVEGLRRKWPVFRQATLPEVCDFWESTHQIFLQARQSFATDVLVISYDDFVGRSDEMLKEVAQFCGLRCRSEPVDYPDKPNKPGKGLRNVVNGKIIVAQPSESPSASSLSHEERVAVENRLSHTYAALLQLSHRQNSQEINHLDF